MPQYKPKGLSFWSTFLKRTFDLIASFLGLLVSGWLIILAWFIAGFETKSNGFFMQERVGKNGKIFRVIKIKTMHNRSIGGSTVTTATDKRITRSGAFFRKTKIDELPQLINVLLGDMSFVGPRPDVPGFADQLEDGDKIILSVRPGITGPATLKYHNEELLLATQENPEKYNRDVIFPDKVKLNKKYITSYSFSKDLRYIFLTLAR